MALSGRPSRGALSPAAQLAVDAVSRPAPTGLSPTVRTTPNCAMVGADGTCVDCSEVGQTGGSDSEPNRKAPAPEATALQGRGFQLGSQQLPLCPP